MSGFKVLLTVSTTNILVLHSAEVAYLYSQDVFIVLARVCETLRHS
jgi:hypothetical protein